MIRISSPADKANPLLRRTDVAARTLGVALASLAIAGILVMVQGKRVIAESRHDAASVLQFRLARVDTRPATAVARPPLSGAESRVQRRPIRVIALFNIPADQAETVERR